jgi:hypothetical protein
MGADAGDHAGPEAVGRVPRGFRSRIPVQLRPAITPPSTFQTAPVTQLA